MKEYILNELSLPFSTIESAKMGIATFVDVCVKCGELLHLTSLRIDVSIGNNLVDVILCDNYSIAAWLRDQSVDKEMKRRFKSIATRPPLIERDDYWKYWFQEKEAKGLAAAFILNTLAVSFNSCRDWDTSELFIRDIETERQESVKHAATVAHILSHQNYFRPTNDEIWDSRQTLLPNLSFSRRVERNFRKFAGFRDSVIEALQKINEGATQWKTPNHIDSDFSEVANVGNHRFVFDIRGNHLRLIAIIRFDNTIEIRFLGTHAEYDAINAATI